jgi:VanZ family protein
LPEVANNFLGVFLRLPRLCPVRSNTLHFLRRLSWALVVAWAVSIFLLSCLSSTEVERLTPFPIWDKLEHFTAYTSGALVLAFALRLSTPWSWKKVLLLATVIISFFGATDEIHQHFTPGRDSDIHDWSADTFGAAVGAGLACAIYAFSQRKNLLPAATD